MKNNILLIDGNSLLFRAYHATAYRGNFMSTSQGIPTNAIFGFANMINKAIKLLEPTYVMVAWDTGKPTFRHTSFEEYKGTRKEVDQELKVQFAMAREYLDAYPIFQYEEEGIEADDIIGSVAKQYPNDKINILSSDKDLLQLIDDTTDVLLMKKGISELKVMDEPALMQDMEITPRQIIDLKALSGDSADNIPGVRGIGDKTAIKLLHAYDSIEGVYEHIEELKGKQKEKLIEDKDIAFMSKMLATIKVDCEFDFTVAEMELVQNSTTVNEFFRKYEMNSLLVKEEQVKKEILKYQIIHSLKDIVVESDMFVQLDYDNENFHQATLYGMMLQNSTGVYYISLEDMNEDKVCNDYLKNPISKCTYDIKMLYHLLDRYGFEYDGFNDDLMIASFLNDNTITNYDKFVDTYHYLEEKKKQDIYGKPGKPIMIDEIEKLNYLSHQIQMFNACKHVILKQLYDKELTYIYREVELKVAYILFTMEKEGITTSVSVLDEIGNETLTKIKDYEKQIFEIVGHQFNVNSPKQLGEVLFDELGLKANKKRSTAIDVLEKMIGVHPVAELLIQYRKYQKIYSTYTEGLKKHILSDGKIHTIFNQCLTQTGRLSSSEPNLQNLSVKDDEAKQVRRAFEASNTNILLTVDYSQIELRVLAHMANEEKMIDAFNHGLDIHTKTAMEVFGCEVDEVTSAMRRQAKVVNFGIVYGQSEFGLSEELGITRNDAKEFMEKYFDSYPRIHEFMDQTINECKENGYVTTLFNRRRYIPEINDKNYMTREFGKRAAMNAPIQGSAADLIKIAMIIVFELMQEKQVQSKMILQIHDELVFDIVKEEKEIMEQIVVEGMQQAYELAVPLVVDYGFGQNYYEVK